MPPIAACVALAFGSHGIGNQLLHRRMDIIIEKPIREAHFESGPGVVGDQSRRAGVPQRQIFDDDAGFDDHGVVVFENGKHFKRPDGLKFGERHRHCGNSIRLRALHILQMG
jgi:hypothetical protein